MMIRYVHQQEDCSDSQCEAIARLTSEIEGIIADLHNAKPVVVPMHATNQYSASTFLPRRQLDSPRREVSAQVRDQMSVLSREVGPDLVGGRPGVALVKGDKNSLIGGGVGLLWVPDNGGLLADDTVGQEDCVNTGDAGQGGGSSGDTDRGEMSDGVYSNEASKGAESDVQLERELHV